MQFDSRFPLSVVIYTKKRNCNMLVTSLPHVKQIIFLVRWLTCNLQAS